MQQITTLERMGENLGICIPANILHKAQLDVEDKLFFDVDDEKRIILTKKLYLNKKP